MTNKNVLVIGVPFDEDDPDYTQLDRMPAPQPGRTIVTLESEPDKDPVLYGKNEQPIFRGRRSVGFRPGGKR